MGDYVRKCKKAGEIAVMEVGGGGVTTRAMEAVTSSGFSKRRKVASNVEVVNHRCVVNSPKNSVSPAESETSDPVPASECSSNESNEFVKCPRSVDLKFEGFKIENSKNSTFGNGRFSRETTPTSELCADSNEEMESSTSKLSPASHRRRKQPTAKMPSTAEIEEFFSVAEKYEQKRFAQKYNYDVVKDEPLVGRYEWVRLKP
ncbi:cyclin-dependent kinase inhibitor 7 [Cornus florida]|uniref:cyclin-dependent kinase inhibitor 7 n=1 Tax=Cornus florida TaxID=4283 RepID=UPI00289AC572|nr:cyclin-dependent kinase inhibitor 7 [Cornus florida]